MLRDIQEELRYLRRVLARRPTRVTLKPEPQSASEELERELEGQLHPQEAGDQAQGDQQEAREEPSETNARKAAALMEYLSGLTEHLPKNQKTRFQASDLKMRMEYLRERLSGEPGIRERIAGETKPAGPPQSETPRLELTSGRLADTFRFLQGLSAFFPDNDVGESMDRRLDSVILQIGEDEE
jgi:hypothetical protein